MNYKNFLPNCKVIAVGDFQGKKDQLRKGQIYTIVKMRIHPIYGVEVLLSGQQFFWCVQHPGGKWFLKPVENKGNEFKIISLSEVLEETPKLCAN